MAISLTIGLVLNIQAPTAGMNPLWVLLISYFAKSCSLEILRY